MGVGECNGYDDGDIDIVGALVLVLLTMTSLTGVGIDSVIGVETATDGTDVGVLRGNEDVGVTEK